MLQDADAIAGVKGSVAKRQGVEAGLDQMNVGPAAQGLRRGVNGGADVDADGLAPILGSDVEEAPRPAARVEDPLTRLPLGAPAGLGVEAAPREPEPAEGIDLLQAKTVPLIAEGGGVAFVLHEARDAGADREEAALTADQPPGNDVAVLSGLLRDAVEGPSTFGASQDLQQPHPHAGPPMRSLLTVAAKRRVKIIPG